MRKSSQRGAIVPLAVLGVVCFGVASSAFSALIAASNDSVPAVPAIGLGTGATIVAALAGWIVRKALSGEITPLPIHQLIDLMTKVQDQNKTIIDQLAADKADLRAEMKASTQAQFSMAQYLAQANGRPVPTPTAPPRP